MDFYYISQLTERSDTKLYSVNWPGKWIAENPADAIGKGNDEIEKMSMITSNNEQYECVLPKKENQKATKESDRSDTEPPEILLSTLFSKKRCTYRMEGYWSYELCHGRHVNQFHENSKGSFDHHYVLGAYKKSKLPVTPNDEKIPTKTIASKDFPYYKLVMTDGTPCDLANDKPRQTSVYYICDENAKDEIIILKEVITCEYEIVVATHLMCKNKNYRPKEEVINQIHCHSVSDSPSVPKAELELKDSILKLQNRNVMYEVSSKQGIPSVSGKKDPVASAVSGEDPMKSFLKGTFCLNGDQVSGKTVILLGTWDVNVRYYYHMCKEHKRWFINSKKDSAHKSTMELFFGKGDVCDATAMPRKVVVRLRCRNDLTTPNAIAMYLLEPSTCSYILVIESVGICKLLGSRDEFGIIKSP
ncbi:uncharacterized protein TRIADDRAFT_63488 [Trichoplax adhaerens]|uniref:Endoplasmic reticulum lectin 1 n=1 Tax=Trichoplax adhaerens TaxID=10228 RepID=B3RKW7_TRIAD|nr:hypothetical protein TRIADDRAFT_63488 [Trichoplax adhaerens]EDV29446.1 hypothetical protein TRIADDRAFT_63488 [Trichoplax adhaerens]|eukprot:XP_002108648.1 hypothetical protein TRIADDRAFT_63488 [Trichoplax adhaerens]